MKTIVTTQKDLDRNRSQWDLLCKYGTISTDTSFTVSGGAIVRVTEFLFRGDKCVVTIVNGQVVTVSWV